MKQLVNILFFLFALSASAQTVKPLGSINPKDNNRITGSLQVDSFVKLIKYASADSNKVLGINASGNLVLRSKTAGLGDVTLLQLADSLTNYVAKQDSLTGYTTIKRLRDSIAALETRINGKGYLTVEADPSVPAWVKSITGTQIANWYEAYSWGNHAIVGYALNSKVTTDSAILADSINKHRMAIDSKLNTSDTSKFKNKGDTVNMDGYVTVSRRIRDSVLFANSIYSNSPTSTPRNSEYINSAFIVRGSGPIRPVCGTCLSNATVNWVVSDSVGSDMQHGATLFDSVYTAGGNVVVHYPPMKAILNADATVDESFGSQGLIIGATVDTDKAAYTLNITRAVLPRFAGNGTSTWQAQNDGGFLTLGTYNQESVSYPYATGWSMNTTNPNSYYNVQAMVVEYVGTHDYSVRMSYTGTQTYFQAFYLVDAAGNKVTANPDANDVVVFHGFSPLPVQVNAGFVVKGNQNGGGQNAWSTHRFNIFPHIDMEAWLIGYPFTLTSNVIKWQPKFYNATTYKIYRSTDKYGARTLIYTGNAGVTRDSGLTPGTLYWYFLVAVISGVDKDVTYWNVNTLN